MAKRVLVPLNISPLSSDPATGSNGSIYFNSTSKKIRIYYDGAWNDLSSDVAFGITDLTDVLITGPADKNIISYDSTTSTWKNKSLITAISEIDGAESGIDADLLDGQHGSYYLDTSSSTQTKSGNLSVSGTTTTENLGLNETQITSKTVFVNVTTPVLLDFFNYSLYRGVEYLIQIKQNYNYAMTKTLLLHDNGTNVALTEYGYVNIGSDINYTFSTSYNGQNVELYVTCNTANITPLYFTFHRTLFDG